MLPANFFIFWIGGHICITVRKNVYDENIFGYAEKFQDLVNTGKWQELSREISDYCKTGLDIQKKCLILCYKVLKNE